MFNFEEKNRLLKLQKDFEDNKISERELSEKEKRDLKTLYHQQINELENTISLKNEEVEQKIEAVNECYRKAIALKIKKY